MTTNVLDVVGLAALIVAGFLLALWAGFAVAGVSCLLLSYKLTRGAVGRSEARPRLVRAA